MEQQQTSSNVRVRTQVKIKEPKKHKVLIFDDNVTPYEFVLIVLKVIFFIDIEKGKEIANNAQTNGSAVVGEYPLDIARSKVNKATSMAQNFGYPLKFKIEDSED